MGLGNRLIASILVEIGPGYIFAPFGALGRKYIVARTSSGAIVKGATFFCFSALPLIAFIFAAGIYARTAKAPMAFVMAAGLGLVWMAAFMLWAKLVTRGHIQYPEHGAGADDAR